MNYDNEKQIYCPSGFGGNELLSKTRDSTCDENVLSRCSPNGFSIRRHTADELYEGAYEKERIPLRLLYVEADPDEVAINRIKALQNCQPGAPIDIYKRGARFGLSRFLRFAEESHAIQEACDIGNHNVLMIKFLNIRKNELKNLIKRYEPELFHFSGHGSINGQLIFCAPLPAESFSYIKIDHADIDEFINAFKADGASVALVVLAACHSAQFLQRIVDSGCARMAIGTEGKAKEHDVIVFSAAFYRRLMRNEWKHSSDAWLYKIGRAHV